MRVKKLFKTAVFLLLAAALFSSFVSYYLLRVLLFSEPNPVEVSPAVQYRDIEFRPRGENLILSGWLMPPEDDAPYIIITHGYRDNRVHGLALAEGLNELGYGVFVFDFRGSGRSEGRLTSFGQHEKYDLLGAVDFLKEDIGHESGLGVIGFSMGAAVSALAAAETPEIGALVMDSSFTELEYFLRDGLPLWSRLHFFTFSRMLITMGSVCFGIDVEKVRPIASVDAICSPIFFIHGQDDLLTPAEHSRRLFKASDNPQDELWLVAGAGHLGSSIHHFDLYLERVAAFLGKHL